MINHIVIHIKQTRNIEIILRDQFYLRHITFIYFK
jgi:hypothetical protein